MAASLSRGIWVNMHVWCRSIWTNWDMNKMVAIFQTLKFCFWGCNWHNESRWIQAMASCLTSTKSKPVMNDPFHWHMHMVADTWPHWQLPYLCIVWHCCLNSLRPSDAIWRHRSGSTLAHVMACCLMAPSHYLNQCWLVINKVQWHSPKSNFTRNTATINH